MDLVELAAGVCPTRDFVDLASFIQMVEAGVGIGLKRIPVELQMLSRVLTLAIGRVGEPHGRDSRIAA
jgi:hypothetical protein